MSNCHEIPHDPERNTRKQSADVTSNFRLRTMSSRRCLWPRRYVMALLLSSLLIIEVSRHWNSAFTLIFAILQFESKTEHLAVGNWTVNELENLDTFLIIGDIFSNVLGGLLIYQFSSHKFLLVSVTAFSILHALTPSALNHHSIAFLLIVMSGQEMLSAPIFTAILTMWKDWGPPEERTRLVTISLCGVGFDAISTVFFFIISATHYQSMSYYVGITGIVWALFWYNIAASTPQSDPLITENEFNYLESKIPSNYQEKTKLKDIPWMSMVKSRQVMILCLIFFKLAFSVETIQISGALYILYLSDNHNPLLIFIPFMVTFTFALLGSSFLMDYLLQKYKDKALTIRKIFLCAGFILQSVFLLGAVIPSSEFISAVFYVTAYSIFAVSIPGILRLPLDLSPRYVPIIAGVGFGFYSLGTVCLHKFADHTFESLQPESPLFICDGVISLFTGVIFGIWGDVEEQPWSFLTFIQRRGNDYRSYPRPDDEDDLDLVPESV